MDRHHFPVERRMGWYALAAAAVFGVLVALARIGFLSTLPGASRFLAYLPYVVVGVVAVGAAVWHLRAVRHALSEMVGMMVGMTFGMIGGFLAGYLVGATNGMFTGSVFGVLIGCVIGWWVGDCCATMGRLEGLMAGLMSGVMGAMTAVMLLNDRIAWFTPLLLIVCIAILSGLTYAIHRERREQFGADVALVGPPFSIFLTSSFLAVVTTVLVMLYGPTSVLFLGA